MDMSEFRGRANGPFKTYRRSDELPNDLPPHIRELLSKELDCGKPVHISGALIAVGGELPPNVPGVEATEGHTSHCDCVYCELNRKLDTIGATRDLNKIEKYEAATKLITKESNAQRALGNEAAATLLAVQATAMKAHMDNRLWMVEQATERARRFAQEGRSKAKEMKENPALAHESTSGYDLLYPLLVAKDMKDLLDNLSDDEDTVGLRVVDSMEKIVEEVEIDHLRRLVNGL